MVKTTLADSYLPLMSAVWNNPTGAYGSDIKLGAMARLIGQQIYSARLAAGYRYGSGGRIGFAWKGSNFRSREVTDQEAAKKLAANLVVALRNAYRQGGTASGACARHGPASGDPHGVGPADDQDRRALVARRARPRRHPRLPDQDRGADALRDEARGDDHTRDAAHGRLSGRGRPGQQRRAHDDRAAPPPALMFRRPAAVERSRA